MKLVEARDLARDHAERKRDRAALAEAVDAEPRQCRMRERNVEIAGLLERLAPPRGDRGDRLEHVVEIAFAERLVIGKWLALALLAAGGRLAELEVHIARTRGDNLLQEGHKVHELL